MPKAKVLVALRTGRELLKSRDVYTSSGYSYTISKAVFSLFFSSNRVGYGAYKLTYKVFRELPRLSYYLNRLVEGLDFVLESLEA